MPSETTNPTQAHIAPSLSTTLPDVALLAGQLAASSIEMYRRDVAAYAAYCLEHGYNTLHAQSLTAWRDALVAQTCMSPHTINRMLAAVKRLVKEAAQRDMVEADLRVAFADVPGVKVRAMKGHLKQHSRTRIAPDEMRRLVDAPDVSTLIGLRDRALLATLAGSGLRASELATLTLAQIETRDGGFVCFVQGKTDTEPRAAHLSQEAKQAIDTWIAARPGSSPFIFTSFARRGAAPGEAPMTEAAVWLIVQKYAQQLHLEHIKPHDFRRFLGTQLARKDIRKAQLALGHKSIETTARHYVLDELEPGLTDHLY